MLIIPNLLIAAALCTGVILLQIFLSKRDSKWPGLILPLISFILSIVVVVGLLSYTTFSQSTIQMITESGDVVQSIVQPVQQATEISWNVIFTAFITFLVSNVPTLILLAIYFGIRDKRRKELALEKMRAQDLE